MYFGVGNDYTDERPHMGFVRYTDERCIIFFRIIFTKFTAVRPYNARLWSQWKGDKGVNDRLMLASFPKVQKT